MSLFRLHWALPPIAPPPLAEQERPSPDAPALAPEPRRIDDGGEVENHAPAAG